MFTFLTLPADEEKAVRARPEILLKPVDRNAEIVKVMFSGSTCITLLAASWYSILIAHGDFTDPKASRPYFGFLSLFMAVTMLDLAYTKACICAEALKRAFLGYEFQSKKIGSTK
jgi:hypothetical protein